MYLFYYDSRNKKFVRSGVFVRFDGKIGLFLYKSDLERSTALNLTLFENMGFVSDENS